MRISSALALIVSLVAASGCNEQVPSDDEASISEATSAFRAINGFGPNGIGPNGIGPNGIGPNGLAASGINEALLSGEVMDSIQASGQNGDDARTFIRYAVACAFEPSQSFEFSWTDSNNDVHDEEYVGHLGLAPEWAYGPLDEPGQRMVSACMAGLVNFYGVHVTVSLRSGQDPLKLHPQDAELSQFPDVEGAFWGNLWADEPYLNACYNANTVDNSRSHLRECAAGHELADGTIEECGIINIVGPCASACRKFNDSHQYYAACTDLDGSSRTDQVITTALP